MRHRLTPSQRRSLVERPRIVAERRLLAIEREIQAALMRQGWERLKRGRGTGRGKAMEIPAALQSQYIKALAEMMYALIRSGRQIGEFRRKAYRGKLKDRSPKLAARITELQEPEEGIAAAYAKRAAVYAAWVDKKVKAWVAVTARKRFRRTISRANVIVQAGIVNGWTRKQMREAMASRFDHYTQSELDRVITTEATRAINLGTYGQEQSDPLVIGWRWQINYKGCPECDSRHAAGFVAKDDITGDMIPPAHPNCECTLEPVFYSEPAAMDYLRKHPEKDPMKRSAA